jgi:uncharacterized membrane protein YfcA
VTLWAAVLLLAVTLVAAFVQGVSGLGFALVVAPVAGLLEPALLPVALLVLMLPLNAYVAWRERHHLDLRGAGWITVARVAATPAGIALLAVLPERYLGVLIGASTILAALVSLRAPAFRPSPPAYAAAGIITGLSETATGIGGPPLALVYQHRPAPELRATIALCFLVGEVVSLAGLALSGRMTGPGLAASGWLLPAVLVGMALSSLVHHRVGGQGLRVGVLGFALVSGVVLLATAL